VEDGDLTDSGEIVVVVVGLVIASVGLEPSGAFQPPSTV
jgi:hypothetical protein